MHLPNHTNEIIVLEGESGQEYKTKFIACRRGLSDGWKRFALAHKLVEGEAIVFQLVEPLTFKVHMVRSKDFTEEHSNISAQNLVPDCNSTTDVEGRRDVGCSRYQEQQVSGADSSQTSFKMTTSRERAIEALGARIEVVLAQDATPARHSELLELRHTIKKLYDEEIEDLEAKQKKLELEFEKIAKAPW